MKKYYKLSNNEIIINPNTSQEENLTEETKECEYCKYNPEICRGNGRGVYCDWFTIVNGFEEIEEE